MVTDVNSIYHGDHSTIYTNSESLCCTPETNITYVNYSSIKNKLKQNNCLLLSMAFKLPEGSPPTYIKKLNATIFTASHKQSTILPKSSAVSCVFKSWKGFYRFLGVSAINVNLQEDKKHSIKKNKQYFTRWLKTSSKYKLHKRKTKIIFTLEEAVTA